MFTRSKECGECLETYVLPGGNACLQASGNKCMSVPRYTGTMLKDRRNNLLYAPPSPRIFILEEVQCKRYGEHIKLFLCFFRITGHLPICRRSESAGRGLHCSAATLCLVWMGLHAPEKWSVDLQVQFCGSSQLAYSFTSLSKLLLICFYELAWFIYIEKILFTQTQILYFPYV